MKHLKANQRMTLVLTATFLTLWLAVGMAAEPATESPGPANAAQLKVNAAEMQASGKIAEPIKIAEPPLQPMTLEINAVLANAQVGIAALQTQFENAADDNFALELIRQIETLKVNAELDVLRVQLKYANEKGQQELANQLASDLKTMTTPRPRRQPIERPASDAGER